MAKLSKKEMKELVATKVDRFSFVDQQVTDGQVSDAVRVGYLEEAIKICRFLVEHGVHYDSSSDFASTAFSKAHVTNPAPARAKGVAHEHATDAKALDALENEGGRVGGKVTTAVAEGASAEVKTEELAK